MGEPRQLVGDRATPHGGLAAQSATPMSRKYLNLAGPQIRKLRYQKGWSQNTLAIRLQLAGHDKGRPAVGKIESRLVHISDYELLCFSQVLGVELVDLYPKLARTKNAKEFVPYLIDRQLSKNGAREVADQSGHC